MRANKHCTSLATSLVLWQEMTRQWDAEKALLERVHRLKEELERVKIEAAAAVSFLAAARPLCSITFQCICTICSVDLWVYNQQRSTRSQGSSMRRLLWGVRLIRASGTPLQTTATCCAAC